MQYVPTCFRLGALRKAYDDPVRPVGLYQFQSAKTELLPPTTKKPKGAPTKRIPSKGEGKNLCSRCGKVGHNKTTCKNPLHEKSAPKKSAPKKSAPKKSAPKKSAPKKSAKKSAPKKTVDTSIRRNRISGKRKKCDSSSSSDEL